MSKMRGLSFGALGLALLTALWWSTTGGTGTSNEAPTQTDRAAEAPLVESPRVEPAPAVAPVRESFLPDQTTPFAERAAAFPQGLRGLCVDAHQRPLADVQVFLLESLRNDPLTLPVLLQQGLAQGPLAETRTAADGSFAIGLHLANEKLYELRCLSARHADTRVGDLRVLPGEWHDVGAVTMLAGTTIRGRVTIAGTNTPAPQASVTIEAGTVFEDMAMRSLPGRERGIAAFTDATGAYELRNAPTRGVVQLAAVAPGFARVLRQNIDLGAPGPLQVDFELPSGLSLAGHIVDAEGRPLAGARLEAWPTQSASPPGMALSLADGRFEIAGLVAGEYRLRALARGCQDLEVAKVPAGRDDLRLVLQPRATVAVRVLAPDQSVQRRYQLGVRRWFPSGVDALDGHVGLVAEVPDQRIRLDGMTDSATMVGLPPGLFVAEVSADGFAKTLSEPFAVEATTRDVSIDVVLHAGGTLRGFVLAENGTPLAGATVETQANGATPDNPVWRMLAKAAPDRITRRKVTTGPDGSFALEQLALANYQLQIDHPDACRSLLRDLRIDGPGALTLPAVRLQTGAAVLGKATLGGKVQGQMKVVLASVVDSTASPEQALAAIRLETVTDSAGAFRMPRRVPPGRYELRAALVGTADPEAQIFQQLLQLQHSSTTLTVGPGQAQVEHHIDLPADH
jgi:protocatechuate 3,4-dioxygenase beta subunit